MEFFGNVLSADGGSLDPKKVQAIINVSDPSSVQEVRSLVGLATLSAPIRNLTKEKVEWQWTGDHQKAMNNVKQRLAAGCTNAFYDPEKGTQLESRRCYSSWNRCCAGTENKGWKALRSCISYM